MSKRKNIGEGGLKHIWQKVFELISIITGNVNVTEKGNLQEQIDSHSGNKSNPHDVTKSQIGLGNVDNTSDTTKPVSAAQQKAIDAVYAQAIAYADKVVANLINGAPTTLDTLGEIADAMAQNEDVVNALNAAIGTKANQKELDSHVNNTNLHTSTSEKNKWNGYEGQISSLNNDLTNISQEITGLNSDLEYLSCRLEIINNALLVNLYDPKGYWNRRTLVQWGITNDLPGDCQWGIRDVLWYSANQESNLAYIIVQITGVSLSGTEETWSIGYNGTGWTEWVRSATYKDIKNLNNIFFPINGGTINGDINVGGKVGIWSDNEGGNVRITSPNNHHWEMDAYIDSIFRIYHGIDNVTEVDKGFYFNSEDGRISSDVGVFALTSAIEQISSSTISSGYVNFTITKSANVKFIHASQILSTGMNSGTRYTIGGLGAGFLPSVNISQLIFTSINMKAFLIIDTNGTVIIEPETNMPAGTSFNLNFAYI